MENRNFAFGRVNYVMLAVCMAVVIIGFVLMGGSGSSEDKFDPAIFSAVRIKVAPVVCLVGFVAMIAAVMYRPRQKAQEPSAASETTQTEEA